MTGSPRSPGAAEPLLAVLFDAAGTLIELREPVGETYARIALAWGVELPAWRLDDAFGRVLRRTPPLLYSDLVPEPDKSAVAADTVAADTVAADTVAADTVAADTVAGAERAWWRGVVRSTFLAADSTLRFDDFEGFFAAAFEHYAGARAWRLREGARNALETLAARGLRLGVVSNFDQRLTYILQELAIADFFGCITTPATCAARKPAGAIFRAALEALAVECSQALYLGDDPEEDLEAARKLGLRVLDVRLLETLDALPARLEAHAKLDPESARHGRA